MKIGIVNRPFDCISVPAREGSLEIWTYEVARRLATSCDVTVYSKRWKDLKATVANEGVLYRAIPTGMDNFIADTFVEHPGIKRLPVQMPLSAKAVFAT